MTLVEFLKARLDEEAGWAQRASEQSAREWKSASRWVVCARHDAVPGYDAAEAGTADLAEYIARHDPARVLREVEANRRIVELHQEGLPNDFPMGVEPAEADILCMTCDPRALKPYYPCPTLRLLALPHADHPDYQEAWRV